MFSILGVHSQSMGALSSPSSSSNMFARRSIRARASTEQINIQFTERHFLIRRLLTAEHTLVLEVAGIDSHLTGGLHGLELLSLTDRVEQIVGHATAR